MNEQLAKYVRERTTAPGKPPTQGSSRLSYRARRWRVRDRLSEPQIAELITTFKHGTAKHILAKRYGIAERSLKKLLGEEGVKRKSWKDIRL